MDMQVQILSAVEKAMEGAISSELCGYDKPLNILVSSVIDSHREEITNIIDSEVSTLIGGTEFRGIIKSELNKNLAKVLIQRMGGELEKQVNVLKQNPQTRAKITLAISSIIDEL